MSSKTRARKSVPSRRHPPTAPSSRPGRTRPRARAFPLEAARRSRSKAELLQRESELTEFIENASVGLHWIGPGGVIQWANKADFELLGYTAEQYIGHHMAEFHEDRLVAEEILARFARGERLRDFEARLKCKDGSVRTVLIDSSVRWENGSFIHSQCCTRDITEKKRAEEELRLIGRLPAENPAPVLRVSQNHVLHYANPKAQELLAQLGACVGEPAPPLILRIMADASGASTDVSFGGRSYTVAVAPVLGGQFTNLYFSDITERRQAEEAAARRAIQQAALFELTDRLHRASDEREIHDAALDAILRTLCCQRASILLFDPEGVMRFVGWRGLSTEYRGAVEGHSPWTPAVRDPAPIVVPDLKQAELPEALRTVILQEGIRALAFIPVVVSGKLAGKFMAYYDAPHAFTSEELEMGLTVARQLGFGIEKRRAAQSLAQSRHELAAQVDDLQKLHEHSGRLRDDLARELAERRHAEEALREGEGRLRLFIEHAPAAIAMFDRQMRYMAASHRWSKDYHLTGNLIGLCHYDVFPELPESWKEVHRRGLAGEVQHCEGEPLVRTDGTVQWIKWDVLPWRSGSDEVKGIIIAAEDITARKQAEEHLRESEERYRATFENAAVGIAHVGLDGKWRRVNNAVCTITGYTQDELRQKNFADITFPDDIDRDWQKARRLLAGEISHYNLEKRYVRKNGDIVWVFVTVSLLRNAGGEPQNFISVIEDISERKLARAAAARLAAIVEYSEDAIYSTDLNWIVASWNRGAERLYGYPAHQAIGKSVAELVIPDGGKDNECKMLEPVWNGHAVENYETVRRRKDGTLFDVSLTVSPIKDAQGKVIGASKVARDISERVRARARLEQTVAARTASLREAVAQMEEFSYTVSHDLRAPLRGMNGYAEVLLEEFGAALPERAQQYLLRIAANAVRLDKMILDVLTFSRVARAELLLERVSVDKLARQIVEHYPGMQAPAAQIQIKTLHDVLGHEPSLTQALSNLLNNAVKFVAPGNTPVVSMWSEQANSRVRIWVADNGIGVNPKYQHRLFKMFERMHPELKYQGTGVGLAIVRKAVERMGGTVGMESDGVTGSRFWLELNSPDTP